MSNAAKVALAIIISVLFGLPSSSFAHVRHHPLARYYPLTRCGPDLSYLCRLHGHFDMQPFHYNLAIYPGCIGTERRPVLVCGTPNREMVWWW